MRRQHTQIFRKGLDEVAQAKRLYLTYSEVYAEGEPWYPLNAVAEWDDLDFNQWWLDGK